MRRSYMSETVTIAYNENEVPGAGIRLLIEDCGCHREGEIVPRRLYKAEPGAAVEHRYGRL